MTAPLLSLPSALLLAGATCAQEAGEEETIFVNLLDNGAFDVPGSTRPGLEGRIPWWRGTARAANLKPVADILQLELDTPDLVLEQGFAVYEPLLEDAVVWGVVRGFWPRITVVDGSGEAATVELPSQYSPGTSRHGTHPTPFEIPLSDFAAVLGRPLEPRLTLRLGPIVQDERGDESVYWANLKVLVPMPLPTEEVLADEIVLRLDEIFTNWFERGLDRVGPRETGYLCQALDVVTGEPYATIPGMWHYFWQYVLFALEVEPDPRWAAAFDAFVGDYLELGFQPETGLPRNWDCEADEPLDRRVVAAAADLGFLLDLCEHGPEKWRARALAVAVRVGDGVLAHGVLPDASIAPKYEPASGAPDTSEPPIRRLVLPAQLARLGALAGDARYTAAARAALNEVEFTHRWAGSWDSIDPDFDDRFGFLGAASVVMLTYHPEDADFGRLADTGWEYFAPVWGDALRYGGSIAADQVRCWELLIDYARVRPDVRGELSRLLQDAVRAHLKGQQYRGGAWGDVTHLGHDPREDLRVGDLPGAPANLLWGLGLAYDPELELSPRIVRALYTAVLRSTVAQYRRDFGYLSRAELAGRNPAGADHRLAAGLVAMLRNLRRR